MRPANALVFLALAHLLAWTLGFGYFAAGGNVNSGAFVVIAVIYMWTPAVAAVVTRKFLSGVWFSELGLTVPNLRGLVIAWALPVAIVAIAIAVSLALPGVQLIASIRELLREVAHTLPPDQLEKAARHAEQSVLGRPAVLFALATVQAIITGPTLNAVVALGEELGWRGLLMHELRAWGFWPSSLVIGIAWGIWHLPLIMNGHNYPGHPIAGPFMMILLTMGVSPLIGYVRLRGGSVWAAAVFHGTFNAAASLTIFLQGGDSLVIGITGATGLATLLAANICLWLRLGHDPAARLLSR